MRRFGTGLTAFAAVTLVSWSVAQLVPQQKNPPFFKGEKRPKDDESKTRSLSGTVKDEKDNPVEGAIVQLKDTKTLQVRSFITKEDGVYHFHGLSTDVDYQVKAEKQGASSGVRTLSVFDSRKSAVIHLKLEPKK
ncbi:MAG: carboxypeptidase-like regulatory domain-containing protein [Bryobacteraceae bacterium]|nr:carboxypeptidase-like regulatory domain-containing protein [Bryobacteraceae bacterium]MDW8376893.1 carboxypeptidase-like regulatory domain-containing protein [Bryobacterales bacterium]